MEMYTLITIKNNVPSFKEYQTLFSLLRYVSRHIELEHVTLIRFLAGKEDLYTDADVRFGYHPGIESEARLFYVG